ncbi:5'-3' exonuclease [Luteimonas deserti]|uniref:Exodeoxyribonuclease IX n=1 Tax=Luteimonas deserti TaxID=2752306 RepID=A0A7Z0QN16_9GAMM|nr:5'-3' exonuclease H3TH domain-containing protein [Luteimonas deserti]NYZ61661.1 exodeoxyribonuclease IX [Luteimonas deserti]
MTPLYLVDASLYVFRAWHSMPDEFRDTEGWPTNAVHGFARFLAELIERERPRHIAIAFDEALDSCFRHRLYPAYKANRAPAPDELRRQFAHCKALCRVLGLPVLADHEYEADDLIGSAVRAGRARGHRAVIVSADKDLSQLLQGEDAQWDFAKGVRWTAAGVKARHGVDAHQLADYLALCGDAVDNIPGVPGIGCKTAASLLHHFGSLDALLERSDEIRFLRFRGAAQAGARVRQHAADALLYRQLTTIACDAPLGPAEGGFARSDGDGDALRALCDTLRFGPLTRRRLHAAAGLEYAPPVDV